ncbi:HEPN domain-containing protein [Blastochloris sulfoviridis]|uniref:HEPN domain-containing protein n=1 Tax=Blastochloris sulfoviridis TaxID=50712 RepID=A0A5M6I5A4_9HYPH|nr:HEPN domain-containing protein [Blastochloris sulfoviridis]KAA5603426.1 HEPN domain-containing protein [Blastochloris sulfoviridis]
MAYGLRRSDLRAMEQAKIQGAILLLENGRYSNAYYLAGYAVEIGLKACIATQVIAETIPSPEFLKNVLNHDFPKLVGLAGLATELKEQKDKDSEFAANWAIVSEWSVETRYETRDPMSAQIMIQAVCDPKSGVLEWTKKFW